MQFFFKKRSLIAKFLEIKIPGNKKKEKKVHKTMNGVEVSSVVIIKTHILYFSLLCYINI